MKLLTALFIVFNFSSFAQVPDSTSTLTPPPPMAAGPVSKKDKTIVDFPDKEAAFKGGPAGLQRYVSNNVQYPETAIEMNQSGRVYLSFVVEKNGTLSNIIVEKSSGYKSLDREAKRMVRGMPKWKPGKNNLRKVRTRCRLPIVFSLT
jgi:protein TonB